MTYPLHVDLTGRGVLVAGGGTVAARRAAAALAAGAEVTVVSPALCEDLADLAASGALRWVAREAVAADVEGCWLVHAATGDRATDTALARAADAQRTWCISAGDVRVGSARTPAVVTRDDVVVGVSTTGSPDPARTSAVSAAIGAAFDTGGLPLRRQRARRRPGPGRVVLVGGGPGDPDLLTLRGRRELAAADVVVHDRLAPTELLDALDPDVVRIDVGKSAGSHPVPQSEINALLVEHAASGAAVVRLKGGDPYVFGRGPEEVAACRAAGIAVDVVPGVSSAFAVPAAAGIPVTARGVARGVLVMTGHELAGGCPDAAAVADAARWCARGNTLVVLMGVATLPALCCGLLAAGLPPSTAAAVVEAGTTPDQRTARGDLATIAALAVAVGIGAPAVIVIGDVAASAIDARTDADALTDPVSR